MSSPNWDADVEIEDINQHPDRWRHLMQQVLVTRLHTHIYDTLAFDLKAGTFAPGEKVTVRELASRYGTGLMPVREALQRLAEEGALDVAANRAVKVAALTQGEFADLIEILFILEKKAVLQYLAKRPGSTELVEQTFSKLENNEFFELEGGFQDYLTTIAAIRYLFSAEADSRMLAHYINMVTVRVGPLLSLPLRMEAFARDYYFLQHSRFTRELLSGVLEANESLAVNGLRRSHFFVNEWLGQHYFN